MTSKGLISFKTVTNLELVGSHEVLLEAYLSEIDPDSLYAEELELSLFIVIE